MAGGMVLMGILVWILPVQQTMLLHATSQFFANGSRAFIHREHIHMKSTKYYLMGLALSMVVFCLITFVPNKIVVFALLGLGPFLPLPFRGRIKFDFTKPVQAFFCGALVTCFQLTAGVSGPMLDMFFQKIDMTRHQVVATKSFTQAISHIVKFIYFGAVIPAASKNAIEWLPWWVYLAVIPTAVIGSNLAKHILNRMSDHQFYKATQGLLWFIGMIYLVKAALLVKGGS
jgi:uncharacterized membrane protein YfcA